MYLIPTYFSQTQKSQQAKDQVLLLIQVCLFSIYVWYSKERRYMVQKTVIWRSRKSFCTVVDDDMLSSFPPCLLEPTTVHNVRILEKVY